MVKTLLNFHFVDTVILLHVVANVYTLPVCPDNWNGYMYIVLHSCKAHSNRLFFRASNTETKDRSCTYRLKYACTDKYMYAGIIKYTRALRSKQACADQNIHAQIKTHMHRLMHARAD